MLSKERKKLRDVDAFTLLDYVKTSIEILMNMKMEEHDGDKDTTKPKIKLTKADRTDNSMNLVSDSESMKSLEEPPKDYE